MIAAQASIAQTYNPDNVNKKAAFAYNKALEQLNDGELKQAIPLLNKAIELACKKFKIDIREFTVIGKKFEDSFGHHWYVGTDDKIDSQLLAIMFFRFSLWFSSNGLIVISILILISGFK